MKKSLIAAILISLIVFPIFADDPDESDKPIEWSFTGEVNFEPSVLDGEPRVYDILHSALSYRYGFFYTLLDFSLRYDWRYTPSESYWLGHYFYLNEGGIQFDFDLASLKLGHFLQRDTINSPYSLFISAQDENREFWKPGLPALMADFTFQTGAFTFESRWFQLNSRSLNGYPDRGANYKVYALHFGDMRFGLQDSTVYTGRVFDAAYFFNPAPMVGLQLYRDEGKPWSEDSNDNSLVGWFYDWRNPRFYLYAQWLLDDLNLDFMVPDFLREMFGKDPKIPGKTAWSLGGYYDFPFGRLGLYHAGATKYTFAATANDHLNPYEYTYFPDVTYVTGSLHQTPGATLPIDYMDNYIGYKYGENNLAFLLDYQTTVGPVEFYSNLEYVISGSKSPANPWHEYIGVNDAGRDTKLLDDPILEHTISARVRALWNWRKLSLYSQIRIGGVFNKLALETAADGGLDIYRPQPGNHKLIYQLKVGVTYRFHFGR
jgi:hypothetical protein